MNTPRVTALLRDRRWWSSLVAAALGVMLLAAATRVQLEHPPHYDELLHALAARGVLASGEPVIEDGTYRRAELYTRAVALAYRVSGDSMIAARLPAWVCGLLLVALVSTWSARNAGLLAGVVTAATLAVLPLTIEMSVFARFYTMHAFAIAIALIAAFEAIAPSRSLAWRVGLSVLSLAGLVVARHLQASTLVALAAGVPALFAVWAYDHWPSVRAALKASPVRWGAIVTLTVVVAFIFAWQLEFLDRLGQAPLWLASVADSTNFYNGTFRSTLPLLWPLMPLATILAVVSRPRVAILCIVFAAIALIVHSIAAQKSLRYVFYVMPFVCVIWGLAFAAAVSITAGWIRQLRPAREEVATWAALLLLGLVFINSSEGTRSAKLVLGRLPLADFSLLAAEADWSKATATLAPLLSRAQTVVASSGVRALDAWGRYDYELNASVVLETQSREEFGRDPRTGRKVIGAPESIAQVLDAPGAELVVADAAKVGKAAHIPAPVAMILDSRCSAVALPPDSRAVAWWCADTPRSPGSH